METRPVRSGDQSVVWDAALKLAVLASMGRRVVHDVHTADLFSRPPVGLEGVSVTAEAYAADGNVTRWTASLEGAKFLGRMPLHPDLFRQAGVDFRRVAAFVGKPVGDTIQTLTECDWLGVACTPAGQIAHAVQVDRLMTVFPKLRKGLREDLMESIRPTTHAEADRWFAQLFNLNAWGKNSWAEASLGTLRKFLPLLGVNGAVETTTSLDMHREPSPLFRLFVERYELARAAYNEAVRCEGEFIGALNPGDLPFYAVVGRGVGLHRADLTYLPGDTPNQVLTRASAEHGEVVAVLGKAVPHLVEVLMEGPMVLPENGSAYWPKSARFAALLERALGQSLGLHPLLSLRLHALDALADVTAELHLPEYLRPFFGAEWISGGDFAASWRDAVDRAKAEVANLSGKNVVDLIPTLHARGLLGEDVVRLIETLRGQGDEFNRQVATVFAPLREKGLGKDDRAALTEAATSTRETLTRKMEPAIFRAVLETALSGIEARRAEALRGPLAATKLAYWDARPFTHWVLALPGWLDGIKRRAELVETPFLPPSE